MLISDSNALDCGRHGKPNHAREIGDNLPFKSAHATGDLYANRTKSISEIRLKCLMLVE